MALKTEVREIHGLTVTSTQLPPMRSVMLMTRMARLGLPAFAKMEGLTIGGLGQLDLSALAPALAELFGRLSDRDAADLVRAILEGTSVREGNGKSVELINDGAIDTVFSGRLPALFAVVRFCVEVNYRDFFAGGLDSTDPESTSSPTSTTTEPASPSP